MTPRSRQALILVAAVLAVGLTLSLGRWQLHRADEKLSRQAAVAEREALPTLDNAALHCDALTDALLVNRRVVLKGQWLPQHTWLLDNRAMDGRAGFYVITAMQLTGPGPCADQVLMVQRGWVPRNAQDRTQAPPFLTPSGPVQLVGRLVPELSRSYSLGADLALPAASSPRIVQNIDFSALPTLLGRTVVPMAVLQLRPETSQTGQIFPDASGFPLRRDWPAPASDVGKHNAYAVQWFALAALITGLYVWFQLLSPLRRRTR
ncbi:SURF1 family protein [Aquabacterium sp.]|uniref:SURF1 family protein n=1 Tax=Aquabacterium sp. TaxID=1872578 RepID=UPI002488A13D|nr:SURF1 family protein [Aquabacterium sp.]MDI1259682.1 SURF1 family protein [Aquabacterium sp.]